MNKKIELLEFIQTCYSHLKDCKRGKKAYMTRIINREKEIHFEILQNLLIVNQETTF